jgi:teichuronic acid biosynthesis glycosyltransferase TuaC
MRVLVVAEYYPRAADPVLGIWAHRQTLAARDAGAEVHVIVLHRPLPSLAAARAGDARAAVAAYRQPRAASLGGVPITYVRYLSPPRPWSYASWGAWAAPALGRALASVRASFPFDLVHAHNAVPAADAVRRVAAATPLVLSVHGGDLYGVAHMRGGARAVTAALGHARLVLANSAGTAKRCADHGARATRIVHLGTDLPPRVGPAPDAPVIVTVGNLIARKRHADVIAALPVLRARHPDLRYVIVGDGPERERLRELAAQLGVGDAVQMLGALDHDDAVAVAQSGSVFVLPSIEEAFGVAYVEAMAGGVPAIGCRGEDGPQEIAAAGGGMTLVTPADVPELAARIDQLLSDPAMRAVRGRAARQTVADAFSWEQCGAATVDAYATVL